MADEKTFTESEHLAVLGDRLAKETANLTAERDQLASRVTELETQLDVAESAKVAAEAKVVELQTEFDGFKSDIEEQREAAARKDERVAKIREAAGHLKDDFFNDARVTRIVAMKDDEFEGYVEDLKVSAGAPASTVVPRETAMTGEPVETSKVSVARDFLVGRRYDAPKEG